MKKFKNLKECQSSTKIKKAKNLFSEPKVRGKAKATSAASRSRVYHFKNYLNLI
jgi:hypothetical protein